MLRGRYRVSMCQPQRDRLWQCGTDGETDCGERHLCLTDCYLALTAKTNSVAL